METKYGLLNVRLGGVIGLSSTTAYRDSLIDAEVSRLFQLGHYWEDATAKVAEYYKPVTCEVRIVEERSS